MAMQKRERWSYGLPLVVAHLWERAGGSDMPRRVLQQRALSAAQTDYQDLKRLASGVRFSRSPGALGVGRIIHHPYPRPRSTAQPAQLHPPPEAQAPTHLRAHGGVPHSLTLGGEWGQITHRTALNDITFAAVEWSAVSVKRTIGNTNRTRQTGRRRRENFPLQPWGRERVHPPSAPPPAQTAAKTLKMTETPPAAVVQGLC